MRIETLGVISLLVFTASLGFSPEATAVDETDIATGKSNSLPADDYVEPVYLDDLEASSDSSSESKAKARLRPDSVAPSAAMGNPSPFVQERQGEDQRRWQAYASLGMSTVSFSARGTIRLPFNRYLSVDPGVMYWNRRDGEYAGNGFGPEVALIGRLTNTSMFTPYAGGGVGYEKWEQYIGEQELESDDTGTVIYFFGLNLRMSKNFALDIARRTKRYADQAPIDRSTHQPGDNPEIATEVSFQAIF